tara:strand:+ start:6616 stop:7518 length:903 start_codon:yes stop_codon:yes gene_type:complete
MTNLKILILSSNTYPSLRNSKVQKKVFSSNESINNVLWYKGGNPEQLINKEANLIERDLYVNASDDALGMGDKTIKSFEWMLKNTDFEYLFRTNTSSYFSYINLLSYIEKNFGNKKYVYAGKIHTTNDSSGNSVNFASGSGYILNRNTVKKIVENQKHWEHEYWDDVSLGLLLRKLNLKPIDAQRFDIEGNPYKQKIDINQYHYRCRIDNHYGYPRLLETFVLNYLSRLHNGKKLNNFLIILNSTIFEIFKFFYISQFGWKVFSLIRKVLKLLLPLRVFNFVKKLLQKKIYDFKLVRFKI